MKIVSFLLFAAICLVIVLLTALPDRSGAPGIALKDPNPMKANAEQFARMQQQHGSDIQLAAK